jgi:DNA adenine methylase
VQSVLRWAGSKLQLLPELRRYWKPTFQRYVEPFCGSASLFFSVDPERAVLSDLNKDLIETLQQIQLRPDHVSDCLLRLPLGRANYYKVRAQNPAELSPTERAARFLYLNTFCFNGLFRTNRDGKFNVPYGSKHRRLPFQPPMLRQAAYSLQRAELHCSDFEPIVERTGAGDFVYLDPPYVTTSSRVFVQYGSRVFSTLDLTRLIATLKRADKRGVAFVLSYANVPEISSAPKKWTKTIVRARRNIAGFSDSRRFVAEVLISNVG